VTNTHVVEVADIVEKVSSWTSLVFQQMGCQIRVVVLADTNLDRSSNFLIMGKFKG